MIIFFITIVLFGGALFFFSNYLCRKRGENVADKHFFSGRRPEIDSLLIRSFFPIINKVRPYIKIGQSNFYYKYLSNALIKAGHADKISTEEFFSYQIVLSVALVCISLFFRVSVLSISCALVAGFFFPLIWLRAERVKRDTEILRQLPSVLDMLTLSVEAGLDFLSASGRIVQRGSSSAVTVELGRMLNEIRLGSTKKEALLQFKKRLANNAVDSFVAMLIQADRLGSSIGPVLRAHSSKLRTERFQRAERAGVVAAQKVLIPLVFLIMPAVFIVVFGPLLVMWKTGTFERLF
jgi:tight adherence protein C